MTAASPARPDAAATSTAPASPTPLAAAENPARPVGMIAKAVKMSSPASTNVRARRLPVRPASNPSTRVPTAKSATPLKSAKISSTAASSNEPHHRNAPQHRRHVRRRCCLFLTLYPKLTRQLETFGVEASPEFIPLSRMQTNIRFTILPASRHSSRPAVSPPNPVRIALTPTLVYGSPRVEIHFKWSDLGSLHVDRLAGHFLCLTVPSY